MTNTSSKQITSSKPGISSKQSTKRRRGSKNNQSISSKDRTKAPNTRIRKDVSRCLWYITCLHTPCTYLFSDVPPRPSPTDNLLAGYSNTRTLHNYTLPILHTRRKLSNSSRVAPEFSRCFRFLPFQPYRKVPPVFSIPSSLPQTTSLQTPTSKKTLAFNKAMPIWFLS